MRKHHLSKKLFFAGVVLFIIGAIGVAFTIKSGEMIEKGEPLTKQWELASGDISKIAFYSNHDTLIELKESTNGKNYIELKGNYSKEDKEAIEKLKPATENGTAIDMTIPQQNNWFNFVKIYAYGQQKLTIYLTKDTKVNNIEAKTSSGDLSVSNFEVNKLVVAANSGEVKINQIVAASAEISTTSGDIELSNTEANTALETSSGGIDITHLTGDLEVNGNSGDVNASGVESEKLKIALDSGEIELTNSLVADLATLTTSSGDISANIKGELRVESSSGGIELEGVTNNLNAKTSSGDIDASFIENVKTIQIDTNSGEIELKLPADYKGIFDANSNSGSVKVPTSDSNTDNRVTVKTSSGDIKIEK
ncbi:DUF4097 domain-containing protein [Listeria monocytogenes]|nr:DUF4097 domain-containing protein [Listeria monocytogenes]